MNAPDALTTIPAENRLVTEWHDTSIVKSRVALVKARLRVERQKPVPLTVDGVRIDCAYRLDLLVNEAVVVEVKSVTQRTSLHRAQMLSYLRLTGIKVGLILNFNVKLVALEGIRCVVNGFEDE